MSNLSMIGVFALMQKLGSENNRVVNVMLKYSETEAQNEFENLVLSLRRENSEIPVDDLFLVFCGSLDLSKAELIPSSVCFDNRVVCSALEFYSDELEGDEDKNDVSECV